MARRAPSAPLRTGKPWLRARLLNPLFTVARGARSAPLPILRAGRPEEGSVDRSERVARRDRAAGLRRQVQAGLTVAALGLTGAVAGWLDADGAAGAGTAHDPGPVPDPAAAPVAAVPPAPAAPAPRRTLYVVVRQAPGAAPPAAAPRPAGAPAVRSATSSRAAAPVARTSSGRGGSSSGPGPAPRPAAQPPVTSSSGS